MKISFILHQYDKNNSKRLFYGFQFSSLNQGKLTIISRWKVKIKPHDEQLSPTNNCNARFELDKLNFETLKSLSRKVHLF